MSTVFMFLCRQQKNNQQLITGCVLLIFKRLQAVNFLCTVKTLLIRWGKMGKCSVMQIWGSEERRKKKNTGRREK